MTKYIKNGKKLVSIVKEIPLNHLLLETDSPYLSPEPLRGKRNDPRNVKYMAKKIAEVKEIPLEEIAKITYQNAEDIFEIKNK